MPAEITRGRQRGVGQSSLSTKQQSEPAVSLQPFLLYGSILSYETQLTAYSAVHLKVQDVNLDDDGSDTYYNTHQLR